MKNSRCSFFELSVTSPGTNVGRREDELQRLDLLQLRLQRLERVDREARGGDLAAWIRADRLLEVVAEQAVDVVDDLHLLDFDDEAERRNSGGSILISHPMG